jgi:hypothetical protein
MGKDPKLPRNSLDAWWILEELTLFEKMLETQNYPGIPGIPGGFLEELTLFQKMLDPKLPCLIKGDKKDELFKFCFFAIYDTPILYPLSQKL